MTPTLATPDSRPILASVLVSAPLAVPEPPWVRRVALLAQGYSDNQIRRDLRRGVLVSLAPGIYLSGSFAGDLTPAERHRAIFAAMASRLPGNAVISHFSAAALHNLPVVAPALPIHVIRPGTAKSRPGTGIYAHRATLSPHDCIVMGGIVMGGLTVTSPARTVLDCALLLPLEDAVPLIATAVRRGQVNRAELDEQLGRRVRVPGTRRVAAALDLALSSAR